MSELRFEVTLENGEKCGPYRMKTIVQYAQSGQLPITGTIVHGRQRRTLDDVVKWVEKYGFAAFEESSNAIEGALAVGKKLNIVEVDARNANRDHEPTVSDDTAVTTGHLPSPRPNVKAVAPVLDVDRGDLAPAATAVHAPEAPTQKQVGLNRSNDVVATERTELASNVSDSQVISRPLSVIVATGAAALMTLVMIGFLHFKLYYTPSNTASQFIETLRKADVARLKVDVAFGSVEVTKSRIHSLGEAEFDRREQLQSSLPKLGEDRALALRTTAVAAARARMQTISEEEKAALRAKARETFQQHEGRDPFYWEANKLEAIMYRTLATQLAPTVLSGEEKAVLVDVGVLFHGDSLAPAVARALGLTTLKEEQRRDISQLPKHPAAPEVGEETSTQKSTREKQYQRLVRTFIETHGTVKLQEELHQTYASESPSIKESHFSGDLPRSLLRSRHATIDLDRHTPDEEYEGHWSKTIALEHRWGKWQVVIPAGDTERLPGASETTGNSKTDALALAGAGALATAKQIGSLVGPLGLVVLLLGMVFWRVTRDEKQSIGSTEYSVLATSIALLAGQHLVQGQVSIDDWFVTPFLIAMPCAAGALRGTRTGYISGAFVGWALFASCVLFRTDLAVTRLDLIPFAELVLVSASVSGLGAASGALARIAGVAPCIPLVLGILCGLLQRDTITSPLIWGHAALASVWTGLLVLMFWTKRRNLTQMPLDVRTQGYSHLAAG